MKKNLISFLFGESQVDDEIAGLVESIADMDTEGAADLKVEKKPLASALSDLGIESKSLENDPRGLSLVFNSPEDYRAAHAILNEPDSLHKLASLGWVYSTQGDVAMSNEPAELRIRFLEIDNIEPSDAKASYSDSDKTRLNKAKDIIKKGREFATTAPDFDDDSNPVDHADPKKGSRDKGVSKAKDGSDPEGTPKGSDGSPSAGKSGSAPGKGDLTQPEEGKSPKAVKEGKIDWSARLKKLKKRRGESVKEAGYLSHGDGTGTYHGGHGAPVRSRSSNLNLSPVAGQMGGHSDDEIAGNAEYLRQSGVLHAPGCECDDCKSDPIGMSSAASRQHARHGTVPFSAAAGHHGGPVGEGKRGSKPTCPHCNVMVVNGVPTHESGCPNSEKTWRSGSDDIEEAGHKSGCGCGFCKNKGNIGKWKKGSKAAKKPEGDDEQDSGPVDETSAEQIVNNMLEGNPGTPPGVFGKGSDRKFKPAKGMVQAAPEGSEVAKQTKPNRRA